MKTTYLKLFRNELRRLESRGGFQFADKYLCSCESTYKKMEYLVVVLLERARLCFLMGQWEDCLALLDRVEQEDALLEADDRALFFLVSARLHQGYGDLNQALSLLEIAFTEAEDGAGVLTTEIALEMASLFYRIGEQERGQDFLEQATLLLENVESSVLDARLLFEKGLIAVRSEELSSAEDYFSRALSLSKSETASSIFQGEGLRFLGIVAALDNRALDALELQKQALTCFEALPYPLGCAKAQSSIGQTCLQLGRPEEAEFFLKKAEAICREIGAEAERAVTLGKLGAVFSRKGQYEKAIGFQKEDLELSLRFGNYRGLAFSLRNLGLSYKAKGDLKEAVTHLRDSRDRFTELEDHTFQIKADLDLVSALLEHDRITEAFGYFEDANKLLGARLEVTPDHANAAYYGGLIALKTKNYPRAETQLWEALEMCQIFSMQTLQAAVYFRLALLYEAREEKATADEYLVLAYRLGKAHSLSGLLLDVVEKLYEVNPAALFEEIKNPRF